MPQHVTIFFPAGGVEVSPHVVTTVGSLGAVLAPSSAADVTRRDATNTGIAGQGLDAGDLTTWPGGDITEAGTYNRYHFPNGVTIAADDVVLTECLIESSPSTTYTIRWDEIGGEAPTGFVLTDCTVDGGGENDNDGPSALIEPGIDYTITRCDLSGAVDILKPQSHDGHIIVQDSFLHRLTQFSGTHNDCVQQSSSAGQVTIRRCTLDGTDSGNDDLVNAMVQFGGFPGGASIGVFLCEDCFFDGGNYAVNASKLSDLSSYDVTFRRNRFGLNFRYGARSGGGGMTWLDNTWDETGTVSPAGFSVTEGQEA